MTQMPWKKKITEKMSESYQSAQFSLLLATASSRCSTYILTATVSGCYVRIKSRRSFHTQHRSHIAAVNLDVLWKNKMAAKTVLKEPPHKMRIELQIKCLTKKNATTLWFNQ